MPWMGIRSRPVTQAGHRRHSSIIEGSSQGKHSVEERNRRPLGSLERLSLKLSHSNDGSFSVLTQEPEDITPAEPSQPSESAESAEHPESAEGEAQEPTPIVEALLTEPKPEVEQERTLSHPVKPQRFSLLKFRHASDPQLSTTYRKSQSTAVPHLPPPTIITTSPTAHHLEEPVKSRSRNVIFHREKKSSKDGRKRDRLQAVLDDRPGSTQSLNILPTGLYARSSSERVHRGSNLSGIVAPPPYGDESSSALALPLTRLSESSRSEGSSEGHRIYAQTTTTHTVSTTTTFFRLPRRKKDKGPLFPLPAKLTPADSGRSSLSRVAAQSASDRRSLSPDRKEQLPVAVRLDSRGSTSASPFPSPSHSTSALTNAPFGTPGPAIVRKGSTRSANPGISTPPVSLAPPRLPIRGRSSTMGSLGKSAETLNDPSSSVTATTSGRTSTSTAGRKSFGDIFSLSYRLRHNSEPPVRNGSGTSPGTPGSKSNSLQIPREPEPELIYPEREESDTPASYLEKLEAAVPRGSMASVLCKGSDEFSKTCLRKYMRGFSYFGDSLDIAVRKMLMEVELPKETQQIDRLLAGFADRYHECNPGIFTSTDEAGIVAFSILLLHSDNHNKNNKKKMQKQDYVKNTQGPVQVSSDILECFYDNICYTPFIHFEDEVAVHSHRLTAPRPKRSLIRNKSSENLRGPVDPYTLILDNKLSILRPSLKDVMDTEDTYSCTGTLGSHDVSESHDAFLNSGVLQIVSARSRPDAFTSQATMFNPAEAQAGLVSIKVAKVGLLWRKDPKKKKAKRPWQEWGAILTDSKLYFFRDVGWIKKLMGQHESYQKQGNKRKSLIFQPPLSSFEPDALMSMDDAVALTDSSYKKHKNGFVFIKHGGFEEVFLANTESEMNDWLGKLNYAAAFRTAGVRMRGLVGTPYEAGRQQISRKGSQVSTTSNESQQHEVATSKAQNDTQMAWEIMFYRRQIINERISDYDERFAAAQKELEHLLRNARHLQILLPVQAKTREAVIFAAARMSAKLKWTRVEVWRTKCHRDLLKADLEQENVSDFPAPQSQKSSKTVTPQKTAPLKPSSQGLNRTYTDMSTATLSPTSTPPAQGLRVTSQTVLEYVKSQDLSPDSIPPVSRRRSAIAIDGASSVNGGSIGEDQLTANNNGSPESHALVHQASFVSSLRSKQDAERSVRPGNDSEEQVLRDAGLMGVEGQVPSHKRPDTSGSDFDRVGAISPEITTRDRGGSVRRSMHRTLRDSQSSHHTPAHYRGKKGRDSGSSFATNEDGLRSNGGESVELKRGTGSFMVHGKKASVVNFGSEWQGMSNEDRMKLRKITQEAENKEDSTVEDGTVSNVSAPSGAGAPSEADEADEADEGQIFTDAPEARRMPADSAQDETGDEKEPDKDQGK